MSGYYSKNLFFPLLAPEPHPHPLTAFPPQRDRWSALVVQGTKKMKGEIQNLKGKGAKGKLMFIT